MSTTLLVVQHVDHEDAALVGALARQRGMTLQTLRPDRGDALPDPRACANSIALVLGGPMSVNERDQPGMDWLRQELDWLTAWGHSSWLWLQGAACSPCRWDHHHSS